MNRMILTLLSLVLSSSACVAVEPPRKPEALAELSEHFPFFDPRPPEEVDSDCTKLLAGTGLTQRQRAALLVKRAEARLTLDRADAAMKDYAAALKEDPAVNFARYRLLSLEARSDPVAVLAKLAMIPDRDKYPLFAYLWAECLLTSGEDDRALRALDKALAALPEDDSVFRARALYLRAYLAWPKNLDQAIRDLNESVALDSMPSSDPEEKYVLRSALLLKKGRTTQAMHDAWLALKMSPSSVAAGATLWQVYHQTGKFHTALRHAGDLVASHPNDWTCRCLMVISLNRARQHDKALSAFKELETADKTRRLVLEKGFALQGQGLYREAVEEFDRDLPSDAAEGAHVTLAKASALLNAPDGRLRDGPAALSLAKRAVATRGDRRDEGAMILAQAMAECGRFDEALAAAKRCVSSKDAESQFQKEVAAAIKAWEGRKPYRTSYLFAMYVQR